MTTRRQPRFLPGASLLLVLLAADAAAAEKKRLTFEQATGRSGRVDFRGSAPSWRWAPDGEHLVEGGGKEAQWVDPKTWEKSPPPEKEEADGDEARKVKRNALQDAFAALGSVNEKRAKRIAGARRSSSEDEQAFVVREGGDLWFHREGVGARRLTEGGEGEIELERLAPDGSRVAFVRGNDLQLVSTESGKLLEVTADGGPDQLNGKLDWVYQEEVYGRGTFRAFWWSPDSAHVAFLSLDETEVHDFTVIDHIVPGTFRVEPDITRYPKAGDPNPSVRLGVTAAKKGKVTWIDLGKYAEDEPLVVRVGWTPEGDGLWFVVQDRIQTWADFNLADPRSGKWKTLIHERSDSWTERPQPPRWLADGGFLWRSHRSGYAHLYRYDEKGTLLHPVTAGEWALGAIEQIDEDAGLMWFTATRDGAVDRNIYRVGLDGEGLLRLTAGRGRHRISFNGDRSLFIDRVSSLAAPTELRLCSGEGEVLKVLGKTEIPAWDDYETSAWELVEVPARDGFPLDVAVLKPAPFDPEQCYPVWLPTYSGPDAPSVRNDWNASAWYQFLAQQGLIVLQVNVRSASGKGHWATEQCYKQLGVTELRDLEDALAWLTAQPWADATRVGITGGSYGGYMSAYALTHCDKFSLGVAECSVFDWGMYDTIYTERYMSTPQLNAEGYEKSSVLAAAKDLKGHLVIVHGVMDDNVHVQNVMQLAQVLQDEGKRFEMMLYPQSRHGIRSPHVQLLRWDLIQEHLLAPAQPEAKVIEREF